MISGFLRFLPWAVIVLLGALNIGLYVNTWTAKNPDALWDGPPMPGKVYPLPNLPQGVAVSPPPVPKAPEVVAQPLSPPRVLPPPPKVLPAKPIAEPEKPIVSVSPTGEKYIVQIGSFVLKLGVSSLVERMRANGINPIVEIVQERVRLNSCQAGPFKTLEAAKEAEIKLKASGWKVEVEETWEGYIIMLSQAFLLGEAVQEMERAEALDVKPLRIVKIETDLPVQKVYLGPFTTKEEARQVSAKVARLGLAVPVIKDWQPKKIAVVAPN